MLHSGKGAEMLIHPKGKEKKRSLQFSTEAGVTFTYAAEASCMDGVENKAEMSKDDFSVAMKEQIQKMKADKDRDGRNN